MTVRVPFAIALACLLPLGGCGADQGVPEAVEQVRLLKDLGPGSSNPHGFASVGRITLFTTTDGRRWRTDGTAAGTIPVSEAGPQAAPAGATRYYAGEDDAHGTELWKTDGTAAGTVLVKDINPGPAGPGRPPAFGSSYPEQFTEAAGTVLFSACDPVHGWALWKTDGTEAGTVLVADVDPRPFPPFRDGTDGCLGVLQWPQDLRERGGRLFFLADAGGDALGLWRSDGTAAGTGLVVTVPRAPANVRDARPPVDTLTIAAGRLFFTTPSTLWASDGTAAGTVALPAFPQVATNARATTAAGTPSLFFLLSDAGVGRSDGTAAGTFMVGEVPIPAPPLSSWLTQVATVVDRVFFLAPDAASDPAVWTSDGTRQGTLAVQGSTADGPGLRAFSLTALEGRLYYLADDAQHGRQLWRADGSGRAERLTDIGGRVAPGYDFRSVNVIGTVGALVLFPADGEGSGTELWAFRTR